MPHNVVRYAHFRIFHKRRYFYIVRKRMPEPSEQRIEVQCATLVAACKLVFESRPIVSATKSAISRNSPLWGPCLSDKEGEFAQVMFMKWRKPSRLFEYCENTARWIPVAVRHHSISNCRKSIRKARRRARSCPSERVMSRQ
jgi:hypothetical protein